MNESEIHLFLKELGQKYDQLDGSVLEIGICGGAALILVGLIKRATTDIDVLYPVELPAEFFEAAAIVAHHHGLPERWINQGPKDLFVMGLPDGFHDRAIKKVLSERLTAYLASRRDQIFFKVYAAADRAGYHVDDLKQLNPTEAELVDAARWCQTHDPSEGFRMILFSMFQQLGYENVVQAL